MISQVYIPYIIKTFDFAHKIYQFISVNQLIKLNHYLEFCELWLDFVLLDFIRVQNCKLVSEQFELDLYAIHIIN